MNRSFNREAEIPAPQLLELKCRNCGSQLSPEDISPQLSAARCQHCHALFAIDLPGTRKIRRPEVAMPKRIRIEERMDGLSITRRWLDGKAWFLLFFAIVWNAFMLGWNGIAISQGAWIMAAFGLIHTGVGLFLIYMVLGLFINSTVITSGRGMLSVKIGPLPWKGNKAIPVDRLEQLYCREKVSHGKNGTSITYKVEAVLQGNRRETLVGGFSSSDQALFIEQQLERHLGITDTAVEGEYGR